MRKVAIFTVWLFVFLLVWRVRFHCCFWKSSTDVVFCLLIIIDSLSNFENLSLLLSRIFWWTTLFTSTRLDFYYWDKPCRFHGVQPLSFLPCSKSNKECPVIEFSPPKIPVLWGVLPSVWVLLRTLQFEPFLVSQWFYFPSYPYKTTSNKFLFHWYHIT